MFRSPTNKFQTIAHEHDNLSSVFCKYFEDVSVQQKPAMRKISQESLTFPSPQSGASLVLAFRLPNKITLVLGSGSLAASRAFAALEADSDVVVLAKGGIDTACDEIRWRASHGQLTFINWDSLPRSSTTSDFDEDIKALDYYLTSTPDIRLVCVTDTLLPSIHTHYRRTRSSAEQIYRLCNTRNIPVNTTDMPDLCDFTFTSTHRFNNTEASGPKQTPLQIGVTTNGHGCRLAGRIRREIVSKLPKEIGLAVENVGKMRALAMAQSDRTSTKTAGQRNIDSWDVGTVMDDESYEDGGVPTPNLPVPPRKYREAETETESFKRRIKWVAQISEYWPISQLAQMSEADMHDMFSNTSLCPGILHTSAVDTSSHHSLDLVRRDHGRILLVGSGPGHPSLLTLATHTALTKLADLVLSDKLVPDAVLKLVPSHVPVRIAKKFPGNADGAQTEMMEAALEAARRGLVVVRVGQFLFTYLRPFTLTFFYSSSKATQQYMAASERRYFTSAHMDTNRSWCLVLVPLSQAPLSLGFRSHNAALPNHSSCAQVLGVEASMLGFPDTYADRRCWC